MTDHPVTDPTEVIFTVWDIYFRLAQEQYRRQQVEDGRSEDETVIVPDEQQADNCNVIKLPTLPIATTPATVVGEPSSGYKCDICSKLVVGQRYRCPVCPDWDYCSSCFENANQTHPMHSLVPVDDEEDPERSAPSAGFGLQEEQAIIIDYNPRDDEGNALDTDKVAFVEFMYRSLLAASTVPELKHFIFKHQPLPVEGRWTRLMALMPGKEEAPIYCKIAQVSLDDHVSYEALSYSWIALKHSMKGIYLDGKAFPVSESLWQALTHLREADRPRYLWIDALCINQVDRSEKSRQVANMKSIYENANQVIVWLGPEDSLSSIAMDLINGKIDAATIARRTIYPLRDLDPRTRDGDNDTPHPSVELHEIRLKEDTNQPAPQPEERLKDLEVQEHVQMLNPSKSITLADQEERSKPKVDSIDPRDLIQVPSVTNATQLPWFALFTLVHRPWFTRVWCLQEIAAAKESPIVMCGHSSTTWETFVSFIYSFEFPEGRSGITIDREAIYAARDHAACYIRTRNAVSAKLGSSTLESLLRSTRVLKATLPSDKIYSLLGLATDIDRFELYPDYSETPAEVFTKVMMEMLAKKGVANLFCFGTNSTNTKLGTNLLPSWVPDWSMSPDQRAVPIWEPGLYHACKELTTYFGAGHLPVLGLSGLQVDTVTHVSEIFILDESWVTDATGLHSTLVKIESMLLAILRERMRSENLNAKSSYFWLRTLSLHPDPRISEAFWRTLLADKVTEYLGTPISPAPIRYGQLYELLRYTSLNRERQNLDEIMSQITGGRLEHEPILSVPDSFEPELTGQERSASYCKPLINQLRKSLPTRQLFVTSNSFMGLASRETRVGDKIAILSGADMPFVLRQREEDGCFQLIGEAYVHSLMQGEAARSLGEDLEKSMVMFPLR